MIHILRDIKLSKLTDTPMGTKASKLVKFWDELWCDMKVKIDLKKGEIRCWKNDYDYYYFFQDDTDNYFWCDFEKVWTFFREDLGFKHGDTQELIQYMANETLNCMVNTPNNIVADETQVVDKTLNCKVNTPKEHSIYLPGMDETLNCDVSTPYIG